HRPRRPPHSFPTRRSSDLFSRRSLRMPDSVNVQALVPVGAHVLPNRHGTAPGLAIEQEGKLLLLLPGPPRELKPMLEEQVLPLLDRKSTRLNSSHRTISYA